MIGLSGADTDIGVSKAIWGANGKVGGPLQMATINGIVSSIALGDCAQAGLDLTDIAGVEWKAFVTPSNKSDNGKVEKSNVVDVTIKAKAAEVLAGRSYTIMGVAGMWNDDGDGIPEASAGSDDSYLCWGIGSGGVTIVS